MTSIFADAVELPPDERSAFVARACGTDADLLREVVSLLIAHDGNGEFLGSLRRSATRTSSRACHSCAWTLCGIRCAATRAFNN
jgi:hypothetical protein